MEEADVAHSHSEFVSSWNILLCAGLRSENLREPKVSDCTARRLGKSDDCAARILVEARKSAGNCRPAFPDNFPPLSPWVPLEPQIPHLYQLNRSKRATYFGPNEENVLMRKFVIAWNFWMASLGGRRRVPKDCFSNKFTRNSHHESLCSLRVHSIRS